MEIDMEHYKIEREELDPTRYNLFRWMDRVADDVSEIDKNVDRGYEDRFYKDPKISRKLTSRGVFLGLYSTLTLPISIPASIYRAIRELKRSCNEMKNLPIKRLDN
ncbi:hypothetical protein ES703_02990 [subsurface metagenome]